MSHICSRCHGRRFLKFVPEARIDVVRDGLICLTPPQKLNDPFEVNPIITELDADNYNIRKMGYGVPYEVLTQEDRDYGNQRERRRVEYRDKYQQYANSFGILSLVSGEHMSVMPGVEVVNPADPRRNLLMWSHYANQHKGFVIEFSSDFMAIDGVEENDIIEVEYDDERIEIFYEEIDAQWKGPFYQKGSSWKYEQEWRLVRPLSEATFVTEDNNHLFRFNRASIVSVTAGSRMSEDNKKELQNLIFNDADLAYAHYLEAEVGNKHNTVEFNSLFKNNGHVLSNKSPFGMEWIRESYNQLCPDSMKAFLEGES